MLSTEAATLRGVGEALGAETFLAWIDPDTPAAYADDAAGVHLGEMPQERARGVALNTYLVQAYPDVIVGVQARCTAADIEDVSRLAEAVMDTLDGRWGGMLGAVRLVSAAWRSGSPPGQDSDGRQSRTDNYYLTIARVIPNR